MIVQGILAALGGVAMLVGGLVQGLGGRLRVNEALLLEPRRRRTLQRTELGTREGTVLSRYGPGSCHT